MIKKLLLVFFGFTVLGFRICGQNIDSLIKVLETAKDTVRANTLISIASVYGHDGDDRALVYISELERYAKQNKSEYYSGFVSYLNAQYQYSLRDFEQSIQLYKKAGDAFRKCGRKRDLGRSLNNMGLAYSEFGKPAEAIKAFLEGVKVREEIKDSAGVSKTLNNLGMAYMETGDFNRSIESLQRSIEIDMKLNFARGLGTSYTNLGNTYSQIGHKKEALACYTKALEYFTQVGDKRRIGNSYNNIGTIYQGMNQNKEAEEYHLKALEIRQAIKDERGLSSTYTNLGIIAMNSEKYSIALPFLEKALALKEKYSDKFSSLNTITSLAETNLKLFRIHAAEQYVRKAIAMANEIHAPGPLQEIYINASNVFEAKGDHKMALEFLRKSYEIKDSLFKEENNKKTAEMEARFHNVEKQREVELLQAKNKIQEVENNRSRVIMWIVSIAGMVSLIMVVIAVRGNIQKRKANNDLQKKNREISEKNEEIILQKHIIEEKNKDVLDSIQYAKRIQEGILPDLELFKAFIPDSFILFMPKDIVSGDFYWCEPVKNSVSGSFSKPKLLFAACDCTGHGVPGAFVTFLGYNALNRCVNEFGLSKPSDILDQMNMLVEENFSKSSVTVNDGMDIALCSVQEQADGTSVLEFAGANSPLYVVRKGADRVEILQPDNQPIGRYVSKSKFTSKSVVMNPGDMAFLFSDGYADQFGGDKGKKLKYNRFRELLLANKDIPMEKLGDKLRTAFLSWKGHHQQVDDICVIGIRV